MKLSEVLNRDQRSKRFSGKRKRKESPEIIEVPAGCQQAVSSLMKQPRRSVIQARSELFPVESNLNESDEDTQLHIDGPKVDKTLIKRAKSGGDIFTDVCMLGMVRDEEKELIWRQIYLHKKFNKGITRVQSSEANANRPSVIVWRKSKTGEEDLDRYLDLDFTDISSITEPSLLEAGIQIEEMRNMCNFPIIDMYNLYLVDEMPHAHCIGVFRDSFFCHLEDLAFGGEGDG